MGGAASGWSAASSAAPVSWPFSGFKIAGMPRGAGSRPPMDRTRLSAAANLQDHANHFMDPNSPQREQHGAHVLLCQSVLQHCVEPCCNLPQALKQRECYLVRSGSVSLAPMKGSARSASAAPKAEYARMVQSLGATAGPAGEAADSRPSSVLCAAAFAASRRKLEAAANISPAAIDPVCITLPRGAQLEKQSAGGEPSIACRGAGVSCTRNTG